MRIWDKGIDFFKKAVFLLENSKAGFSQLALTFLFAVMLRNFLEHFSTGFKISPELIAHYTLAFAAIAVSIILLFWLATGEKVKKIARVVLPCFLVLVMAPLIDLAITWGEGAKIGYIIPGMHEGLVARFFLFTGNFSGLGITNGMKIEVAFVLILAFAYFCLKNRKMGTGKCVTKSLFFSLLLYALVFFYGAILFPAKLFLENFGLGYESIGIPVSHLYLAIIFFGVLAIAYLAEEKKFRAVLGEMPFLRLAHFELMFVLGIAFGLLRNCVFRLEAMHVYGFVSIAIAIALASVYSMFSNNVADLENDKNSGKKTAIAKGKIGLEEYRKAGVIFLAAALFYALMVNFQTFFIILFFAGNYYLYSMPPLRLKRVPVLSKLLISLNSLALVMLGYIFVTGSLLSFPLQLIPIFLIGFTLALSFIDIKDFASDKKAGVKTLPVLIGLKKSKTVIGLAFVATYVSFASIVVELWAISLLFCLGLTQLVLIKRKGYKEKPVLVLYLLSIIVLIFYLFAV